jgi:hypothetical protein
MNKTSPKTKSFPSLDLDIRNLTKFLENSDADVRSRCSHDEKDVKIESKMTINLHVFYTVDKELHTTTDLKNINQTTQELTEQVESMNTKPNLIYYISTEDLAQTISACDSNPSDTFYIKLVPEKPQIKKPNSHRQASPTTTRRPESSPRKRKSSARHSRSDKQVSVKGDLLFRCIKIRDESLSVGFVNSLTEYSIFVLNKIRNGNILCVGTVDENIHSSDTVNMKSINVKYNNIDATIYADSLTELTMPIYVVLTTETFECTAEKFMALAESILNLGFT